MLVCVSSLWRLLMTGATFRKLHLPAQASSPFLRTAAPQQPAVLPTPGVRRHTTLVPTGDMRAGLGLQLPGAGAGWSSLACRGLNSEHS